MRLRMNGLWVSAIAALVGFRPALAARPVAPAPVAPVNLPAVSFNPEAVAIAPQLGVADSPYGAVIFWLRGTVGTQAAPGNDANFSSFNQDIIGNLGNGAMGSEGLPGLDIATDRAAGAVGTTRLNLGDAAGGANHSLDGIKYTVQTSLNGRWHQHAFFWDTGYDNGRKRVAYYIDGVNQGMVRSENGAINRFLVDLNNALGFGINFNSGNGGWGAFDIAQVLIDTHTKGLLNADQQLTIPVSRFYNKGPVDFGPNGASVFGSPPEIYFNGPAATFLKNLGTAPAAFRLVPSVVTDPMTVPHLYDASYGPLGIKDGRPAFAWASPGAASATQPPATLSSGRPNNAGQPIRVGQLLIVAINIVDSRGNFDRAIQTPATAPGNQHPWIPIKGLPLAYGVSGFSFNTAVFWKIAEAGDVTAPGQDWAAAPVFHWTPNAAPIRSVTALVFAYDNASTIQASAVQGNAGGNPVAPSVKPTGPLSTLLTLFDIYDVSNSKVTTIPANQRLRFKRKGMQGSTNYIMASDEPLTGSAPTGVRTATESLPRPTVGISIVIGP